MKRGIGIFITISVLGLMSTFFYTSNPSSINEVINIIDINYLLLCIFFIPLFDWFISGLRMWLFSSVVCPKIPYGVCVKNCAVGGFMAAATPSQTGGGAAQAYVLVKEGASPGEAIGILFMTFLSTLIFYLLICLCTVYISVYGLLPGYEISKTFLFVVSIFTVLAISGLSFLVKPKLFLPILDKVKFKSENIWSKVTIKLINSIKDGSNTLEKIGKKHKLRFLFSIVVTFFIFGNKYFASYLAAKALSLSPNPFELIIAQITLNAIIYFFPTPGGSGGAEIGSSILMEKIIPGYLQAPYTTLWRTSTMYLAVIAGGFFLMKYSNKSSIDVTQQALEPG